MELLQLEYPEGCNIILGQSHFIKTVEDLYEAIIGTVPGSEFGLAFSEASGLRLVRSDGTNLELKSIAEKNLLKLGCGHTFMIVLSKVFPIQILNQIKNVPEVCRIYCATGNLVQVIVARSDQGGGVMGVIDGEPPFAVEIEEDIENRLQLLQKIGYKR
ncbi:MAG: adenosine-specific kinase [Candidatus Aegiribacteria sp.]|nr:adenosine-specific kinase [Candidatus Aegiribacteria sp.]